MMKKYFCSFLALSLLACAHHRDVRPGDRGIHKVSFQAERKEDGAREALSQANHYCEQKQKEAVVVSEGSKYTGNMKEDSYNTSKTAAKVATGVGSAGYVFGGKNESTAGGILGLGGGIADGAIGKGYTYEMKFKCQ